MPSYEDQEFQKMAKDFAGASIPDSGASGYDISDGRHTGVITDVGRKIVGDGYRLLFIQYDITSPGKDKGATPQGTYFLPSDEALELPDDSAEYRRAMNDVGWFNDAFVRITGKSPYENLGSLIRALNDGSLLRALKGRRAILQASHSKPKVEGGDVYLRLRVRQGIGPTVAETQPFEPKPTKGAPPKKRKAPVRKTKK